MTIIRKTLKSTDTGFGSLDATQIVDGSKDLGGKDSGYCKDWAWNSLDRVEFWISCQWLAFLSSLSCN